MAKVKKDLQVIKMKSNINQYLIEKYYVSFSKKYNKKLIEEEERFVYS